jgi:hypothetical protein
MKKVLVLLLVLAAAVGLLGFHHVSADSIKPAPVQYFKLGDELPVLPYYDPQGLANHGFRVDCDDSTIFEYLFFNYMGYVKVYIMYGNLNMTGENYYDSNHYWVIVQDQDSKKWPYDYGFYCPDPQHFEGHVINYPTLLYWAHDDY